MGQLLRFQAPLRKLTPARRLSGDAYNKSTAPLPYPLSFLCHLHFHRRPLQSYLSVIVVDSTLCSAVPPAGFAWQPGKDTQRATSVPHPTSSYIHPFATDGRSYLPYFHLPQPTAQAKMPAKVDNLDAVLMLEKRREQNRAAQKRFRERKAASRQQRQNQSQNQIRNQNDDQISNQKEVPSHPTTKSRSPVTPIPSWVESRSKHSMPSAEQPSLPYEQQQQQPHHLSGSPASHTSHYLSDVSSAASSRGYSFSGSSSTFTSSSPSETGAAPTSFETTAAQLSLFDIDLPPPKAVDGFQERSQDIVPPDMEVISCHGDLESIREMCLFGGGESWTRPLSPSPPPDQRWSPSSLFDWLANYSKSSSGATTSECDGGSDAKLPSSGSSVTPTLSATRLELALHIAQRMTKNQCIIALDSLYRGQFSPFAFQNLFSPNPSTDKALQVTSIPFRFAMQSSLFALGCLADDGWASSTNLIADIWPQRSGKFLVRGQDGHYVHDINTIEDQLALLYPDSQTELGFMEFLGMVPRRLSRFDHRRRIARLRDAPNMHPTKVQMEIPHSVFIDVLPWPEVRDKVIRLTASGKIDGMRFKSDMMGKAYNLNGEGNTLRIHGDEPLDGETWELSEGFLREYQPLIDFDWRIIKRTNFWRRLRGDPFLVVGKGGAVWRETSQPSMSSTTTTTTMYEESPAHDLPETIPAGKVPSTFSTNDLSLEATLEELLARSSQG